jgi:hypothetical protein
MWRGGVVDAATVGVILTGLSGVLLAVGQIMGQTRFSRAGLREMRRRDKRNTRVAQVAFSHIVRLERTVASAGGKVPRRPPELDPDWGYDDDDELAEKRAEVKGR